MSLCKGRFSNAIWFAKVITMRIAHILCTIVKIVVIVVLIFRIVEVILGAFWCPLSIIKFP